MTPSPEESETQLKQCCVVSCEKSVKKGHRVCSMHSARLYRTGRYDLKSPYEKMMERTKKNGSCIEYIAYTTKEGYGRLRSKGKKMLAHRLAWQSINGIIPDGKLVCHKCDNPKCVNVKHLFLGTHKDNYDDAFKKGRVDPVKRAKERWKKCPTLRK